jgi:hypothetical protein
MSIKKLFLESLSKGHSWFDKPVLSGVEGLTTNGLYRRVLPKETLNKSSVRGELVEP